MGQTADFVVTGSWSQKSAQEAARYCRLQQILSAIQTGPKSEISPARFNGGFAKSRLRQRGKKPVIAGLSRSVALQTLDNGTPPRGRGGVTNGRRQQLGERNTPAWAGRRIAGAER